MRLLPLPFYWENDFPLGFQPLGLFHIALEIEMVGPEQVPWEPQSHFLLQRGQTEGCQSVLCGWWTDILSRPLPLAIFSKETQEHKLL